MKRLRAPSRLLPALVARLTAAERAALTLLGDAAAAHGSALYLVGGSVRDLLLGRAHLDLDFVVEADAIAVARAFARASGARLTTHEAFRTATVTAGTFAFDLVTARRESYPAPGALPIVTPSTLADDLARRDFTINAMALAVTGPRAGTLIDPYGGCADLAASVLRVLRDGSFRDDATRLWRAGRYVARLTLHAEPSTARQARDSLPFLATIGPARIHHELERTLGEAAPERALRWLDGMGILAATFPALACTAADAAAFPRLRSLAPRHADAAAIAMLALDWDAPVIAAAAERLDLDRHERAATAALPDLRATLTRLALGAAPPSVVVEALERVPPASLAAVAARHPQRRAGRLALAYLQTWRHVRPLLTAEQVMASGVAPGPLLGELLRRLRAARLDGVAATLDDELRLLHTELDGDRDQE